LKVNSAIFVSAGTKGTNFFSSAMTTNFHHSG
jgi:hypothetical protein